jgi:hypothetical protein
LQLLAMGTILARRMLSILIAIAVAPFVYRGFKEQVCARDQLKESGVLFRRWVEIDTERDRHVRLFCEAGEEDRLATAAWHRCICLRLGEGEEAARARWRASWDDRS